MTIPHSVRAAAIIEGLGGVTNIVEIDPCATRLRTLVKDPSHVDAPALKAAGAFGVMVSGQMVQVVIGPDADTLASELAELM